MTTEQLVAGAILLLTLIAGGLINLLKPSKQLRTGAIVVMIAVLAVSLLFLTVWKEGIRTAADAPNPEAGSASIAASTTQAAAPVTTTVPPTTTARAKAATVEPPVAAPVEPSTQYLADLKAVSGTFKTGTSTIGGNKVECGKSLLFSLNTFSSHRSAVFNLEPGLTTFAVKLGLDKGTEDGVKAHFQVYLDGAAINTGYILDVYSVEEIGINVSGKSRLELTTDGVENDGGGTGHVGDATWCDARLTK